MENRQCFFLPFIIMSATKSTPTSTSTAPAAAPSGPQQSGQEGERKQFCIHCVTGFRIPGEPKGKMEKIGEFDTYIATPSQGVRDPAKAIIYFYDAFGLKLANNKILPDTLADATGLTVYVPDVFNGGGVAEESLGNVVPSTAEEAKKQSYWGKLKVGLAFASAAPFFIKNLPGGKVPKLEAWLTELKQSRGHTRLGGTGYCYGGNLVLALNATSHINVSVANHPSMIQKSHIEKLRNPTLFNCAEEDQIFPTSFANQCEKDLDARIDAPVHIFKHYPNTVHGFAARPNFGDKQVKEAFEGAITSAVDFWKAHL